MRNNVRKLVLISLFLALGIVVSYFESWLPLPIPVPGVKLGLANILGLITLYYFSPKEYVGVGALRVLIVGLLRGSLINLAISAGGWLASTLIVLIVYYLKRASIYGLSIASAFMHSLGQIIIVIAIYNLPQMINYLPIIFISSVISSIIIGLIASIIISRTKHLLIKEDE